MLNLAENLQETNQRSGRKNVIRQVAFHIKQGESVGLTGKNCLSATLKFLPLLGFESGDVYLFGKSIGGGRKHCLGKAGALIEYPALFPDYSIRENIRFFGAFLKYRSEAETDRLIELLGLKSVAGRKMSSLSESMRQRAYFLIALMKEPSLIVLDEPQKVFAFSDEKLKQVLDALKRNVAFLITGTDKERLTAVCDKVFALEGKKLLEV